MRNLYSVDPIGSKFIHKDYLPNALIKRDNLYEIRYKNILDSNYGVPNCRLNYDPINGVKISVSKKCNVYHDNAVIRGMSWLVDEKVIEIFSKVNMPKYECWDVELVLKQKILTNYKLIHFYHEYFQEVDFEKSIIEKYTRDVLYDENNKRYRKEVILDNDFKINSFNEWNEWKINPKNVNLKIRLKSILFKPEVVELDLIPYSYSTILVSENLKNILEEEQISCLSFSEIPFHEFKPF